MKLKEALTQVYLPTKKFFSVRELCAQLEKSTVLPSDAEVADRKLEGVCDEKHPSATRLFVAPPGALKKKLGNKGSGIETKVAACLISSKDEHAVELANRLDLRAKTCFIVSPQETFIKNRITTMELFNADLQPPTVFLNPMQHGDRSSYKAILKSQSIVCENIESMVMGLNVVCGKNVEFEAGVRLLGNNTIGDHCKLGRAVVLHPGVVLAPGTVIGDRSIVHSGTVIGSDGFGYEAVEEKLANDALSNEHRPKLVKIPQLGRVFIGSDVEIGANVAIDRATLSATVIGNGVKIDNLVQIAHNVEIGDDCIIVSQVGIAGSSKLGRGVTLAGQVGVADHCDIGDGVRVGAQSGIASGKKIASGSVLFGSPAIDFRKRMRIEAAMRALVKK